LFIEVFTVILEEITLSKTDSDTFTSKTIACLLNAMKLNCTEARQRFPRLLQLVEMYPNNVDQFKVKVSRPYLYGIV
jgi:hypothetical protein